MVKIIFQAVAHHVLKRVYGCKRVLHCRWNIWFSLAGPRPVTHSAGLMQSVYPSVTLTIHLWPTAQQHQELNKLSLQHYGMIYFYVPWGPVPTCHVIIVLKDMTGPEGLIQVWSGVWMDPHWTLTLYHPGLSIWATNILQGQRNLIHSVKYEYFKTLVFQWCIVTMVQSIIKSWESKNSQFKKK